VVTNLPEAILPGSLFAEPTDGLEIRSVRYRARPVEEDVRQEVRELDDQIQAVEDQLAAVTQERQWLEQRKVYLQRLESFSGDTSQRELKSGVLNSETLKDLTQFLFAERESIGRRELELNQAERAHRRQHELVTRKRQTIAAGSARTIREAVVFINAPQTGDAKLRLSYLVNNASWTPSYNLRASKERNEVTVEYNASIQQMSGEDWGDVEMVLSTATPSLVAKAPTLEALAIKLGAPEQKVARPKSVAKDYMQVQQNRSQLEKLRGSAANLAFDEGSAPSTADSDLFGVAGGGGFGGAGVGTWGFASANSGSADRELNRYARELQMLDIRCPAGEVHRGEQTARASEGVCVSYQLANRTSLPTRADRQVIQIASVPLGGDFYRLATPVLTSYVYEEARLANNSDYVFLAGPVATFLGGEFVGRGDIPTVSMGETFTVGLGIDPSLRATRELVKKGERVQGGNLVVDFDYELSLENFGDQPVEVRLLDRLPTAGENDVKVTLVRSDKPVSEDEAYQLAHRKDGILRWDVEAAAQAVGPQRNVLRYTMQIEYDKQLAIVGMPAQN
jgi:hypothetical protein